MDSREVERLARRVQDHFEEVDRTVFRGDPVANPRLKVEVVDPEVVEDTATLVLITPWTLNGVAFPPDGVFPESLTVGKRRHPVFRNELEGIGPYCSVNLVGDVSRLQSPDAARQAARTLGEAFRRAVALTREEGAVDDRSRRDLFKGLFEGSGESG
jgi:hypothetical protein